MEASLTESLLWPDLLTLEPKLKIIEVYLFIKIGPKTGFNYGWSSLIFNVNLFVLEVTNWFVKKFSGQTID